MIICFARLKYSTQSSSAAKAHHTVRQIGLQGVLQLSHSAEVTWSERVHLLNPSKHVFRSTVPPAQQLWYQAV
ncbi:hypothetical protein CFIMG_008016RA00001 [Ceratocystis fimbriata CBS 114723]|uniref:Uncharacterized protein n=1 Tax=Ceratocystis fimbriata CBS 114723 TaxID=1035309 RepID=A0A2C5X9R2_9PEZI|nr:hypothetical protein CFIMG_008016RA00001 [Ceratocystis fimbriata CBS 114723]